VFISLLTIKPENWALDSSNAYQGLDCFHLLRLLQALSLSGLVASSFFDFFKRLVDFLAAI
jgi:hypothetical protein